MVGPTKKAKGGVLPFQNIKLTTLSHKRTGPKYSLGGRFKYPDEYHTDRSPGPGAYTIAQYSGPKPAPPSFSLVPRREMKAAGLDTPGPSAYNPDRPRTAITVSLQSRNFMPDSAMNNPGPGAYTPTWNGMQTPRWSLQGRTEDPTTKSRGNTPGPCHYNPQKPQSARAVSLKSRMQSDFSSSLRVPGPGAYDLTETGRYKRRPPSFSLGGRIEYNPNSGVTPGPGTYTFGDARTKVAFSITPRRDDLSPSKKTPGPGAYSPQRPPLTGIGMGIGDRFPDQGKLHKNPGPGAYTPTVDFYSVKPTSPSFSLLSRRNMQSSASQPGPGAYVPRDDYVKVSSPRFSLTARTEYNPQSNLTPGPSHYNPQRPSTATGITMKSRIEVKPPFVTPSPVAYRVDRIEKTIKHQAPSYSLGPRIEYAGGASTPGPGSYETAFSFN